MKFTDQFSGVRHVATGKCMTPHFSHVIVALSREGYFFLESSEFGLHNMASASSKPFHSPMDRPLPSGFVSIANALVAPEYTFQSVIGIAVRPGEDPYMTRRGGETNISNHNSNRVAHLIRVHDHLCTGRSSIRATTG